jgi:general secretion pathway protein N
MLVLAAGLVAAVAALAVLPARWLIWLQDRDARIGIADAAGTIWNGTAIIELGPPGMRRTLPQPVSWHLGWGGAQVTHPWLAGPLQVSLHWNGLGIGPQSLRAPADVLAALGAPFNTLNPSGQLEARWQAWNPGDNAPGPVLDAHWRDAGSALSRVRPLGNYRLSVTRNAAGALELALTTEGGALELQARGAWHDGRLQLQGSARPAADAADGARAGLEALLSAIGRREGERSVFSTRG